MSKESLFMIKPSEQGQLIGEEATRTAIGLSLKVRLLGEKTLTQEEAILIYQLFTAEPWFPAYIDYLISGPILVYLTEGDQAIEKTLETRELVRGKYAEDRQRNAIHAPKDEENLERNLEAFKVIFQL